MRAASRRRVSEVSLAWVVLMLAGCGPNKPAAPAVDSVASRTNTPALVLSGSKPAGTAIDIGGVEAVALAPAASWTATVTLAEGANHLAITARNSAGLSSDPVMVDIELDTTPPAAPAVDAPASPSKSPVALSGGKEAGAGITIDGALAVAVDDQTVWSASVALPHGAASLAVRAVDDLGNSSAAVSVSVEVDAIAPAAPTVDPVASPTRETVLALAGGKEAGASVWLGDTEIAAADASTRWSHAYTFPSEGSFTLVFRSRDDVGNESDATAVEVAHDVTPPAPPAPHAFRSPTNASPLTLTGTKEAGSALYVDGTVRVPAGAETAWSVQLALVTGANPFVLTAVDGAGNVSEAATVDVVYDPDPPAAPVVDAYAPRTREASVTLTGAKEAGAAIQLDGTELVAADAATSWTATLPLAEGPNAFDLAAVDAAGNRSEPAAVRITRDSTAPVIIATTPADGATGVETSTLVTVTFDEAIDPASVSTSSVYLSRAGTPVAATLTTDGATVTLNLSGLLLNQTYTGTVTTAVTDLTGNPLAAERTWSFTVRGGRWSTPAAIDSGETTAVQLALDASEDGHAAAVWTRSYWDAGLGRSVEILYVARLVNGSWSAPEQLAISGNGMGYPEEADVAVQEGGRVHIAYKQPEGTYAKIWVVDRGPADASWTQPFHVNSVYNGDGGKEPKIDVDSAGRVMVVWHEQKIIASTTTYFPHGRSRLTTWSSSSGPVPVAQQYTNRDGGKLAFGLYDGDTLRGTALWSWTGYVTGNTFVGAWNYTTGQDLDTRQDMNHDLGLAVSKTGTAIGLWRQDECISTGCLDSGGKVIRKPGGTWKTSGLMTASRISSPTAAIGAGDVGAVAWAYKQLGTEATFSTKVSCFYTNSDNFIDAPVWVDASFPALAVGADGTVHVAAAVGTTVQVRTLGCGNLAWGSPVTLNTGDTGVPNAVRLRVDAAGRLRVVWLQSGRVQAASFD